MKADDLRKRGEVIRNLGSIRNDLIAQAKANGQSGINTAREIEMATAGLNENSSAEEILGALDYMTEAAKKYMNCQFLTWLLMMWLIIQTFLTEIRKCR